MSIARFGGGAQILTNGGDFRVYGQDNPTTGRATGNLLGINVASLVVVPVDGIFVGDSTIIDTRVGQAAGAPSGNIILRGQGFADVAPTQPDGIEIGGASLRASTGNIVLDGRSGLNGTGVTIQGGLIPALATESGSILVTGIAGTNSGVSLLSATVRTTAGGSIDIRGRGGFAGLDSDDSTLSTAGAGLGTILISGESTVSQEGVNLGGTTVVGGASTTGNIIVRATNAGGDDSINIQGPVQGGLHTTGIVNLRPGGVSAAGALTPADTDLIAINGSGTVFSLSSAELLRVAPTVAALVIGGSSHTGSIVVGAATAFSNNLTLQNAGAGSAGIQINGALSNPGRAVTLSSGGLVESERDRADHRELAPAAGNSDRDRISR